MSSILKGLQLNELSNKKLGDYKIAAGADASKADSEGDYKRGNKRMSGIIKATKKEFANDANGLKEDFEDMPNELMDPQAWKSLDIRQKYKALVGAGLITAGNYLEKKWMNDDGTEFPIDHPFAPDGLKDGSLDLNRIYRSAQADYQNRTHSSNVTSQDRENELTIGSEGRAELKRKADELSELKREKLRNERLADEATAFQRAETVQQRKDEMQKIADQYKHDLTIIDKEHGNNMEAIKTSNKLELDKLDKEYADAQRERDFKGSETDKEYADAQREREFKSGESDKEFRDRNADRDFRSGESDKEFRDRNQDREFKSGESDKDYADRQREREHSSGESDKDRAEREREREHSSGESDKDRAEREREREQNRPKPEKPKPVEMPEPEDNRGNKFDQDTGEPIRPQSNQWHTNQQVGYTPTKPSKKNDDVTDVELKPNKPLALGNSVKEAGPGVPFRGVGGAFNRGDDERHDLDTPKQPPQIWGLKINGKVWQKNGKYVTFNSKEAALNIRNSILKNRPDLQIGLVTQGGTSTSPAPTKPAPQKPLMAVSMDRWKEAVLKRYPEAKFMTQKMINGATIAMDKTGQVGIYDPKNSYAKVGPETQSVAKPMNEGVPSDNDMGVVPDARSGTSTKMTLGQWKQMWLKKMPHADQGMFRYPPAMKGSFIAYFDGWENTPGARWDPMQSMEEEKQRLDPSCWKGYKKQGTKMKGDTRVNNCVPVKESAIMQGVKQLDEDWKKKLGAAALAGSMALGAAGASADTRRVTPDGQGGFTGGMKPSATVVAPDNTPSATPPTSSSDVSDPFKGLVRADSADRQAKTITVGGKEYGLVEISSTDIRPRSGQRIVVPQAVLGERGIGNYTGILVGDRVFVISK